MLEDSKIQEAVSWIKEQYSNYNPVCMISFGKDSIVMLHLMLSNGIRPQIIFYADPYNPKKYEFPNTLIEAWGLEVYNYPPIETSVLWSLDEKIAALVSVYWTGPQSRMCIPKNTDCYKSGDKSKYFCGLDYLNRPRGVMDFPWNAVMIGHKDCDTDDVFGEVKLKARITKNEHGPDFLFPIKDWSHADIWDYIDRFNVPMQRDRYDVANRTEYEDKTTNSDWLHACIKCFDKRIKGKTVHCPKINERIRKITVPDFQYKASHFENNFNK